MKSMMSYYKRAMDSFRKLTSKTNTASWSTSYNQRSGKNNTNANADHDAFSIEFLTAAWDEYRRLRWLLRTMGFVLGGCTMYYRNRDTVPFTKRTRFLLFRPDMEKELGEKALKRDMKNFQQRIYFVEHPASVRAKFILDKITEAMQEEVKRCKHLDGLDWEILLVNDLRPMMFCYPGGKIVISRGYLRIFRTEIEWATIIGQAVAQVVARHPAEVSTNKFKFFIKKIWFAITRFLLLDYVFMPDLDLDTISKLVLEYPSIRMRITEADYIGLLLVASAGYDPKIAYTTYEKLRWDSDSHPILQSGIERSQSLAQTHVIEEALAVYNQVRARKLSQQHFLTVIATAKNLPQLQSTYRDDGSNGSSLAVE